MNTGRGSGFPRTTPTRRSMRCGPSRASSVPHWSLQIPTAHAVGPLAPLTAAFLAPLGASADTENLLTDGLAQICSPSVRDRRLPNHHVPERERESSGPPNSRRGMRRGSPRVFPGSHGLPGRAEIVEANCVFGCPWNLVPPRKVLRLENWLNSVAKPVATGDFQIIMRMKGKGDPTDRPKRVAEYVADFQGCPRAPSRQFRLWGQLLRRALPMGVPSFLGSRLRKLLHKMQA